jgi:hypothetical protein
LRALRLSFREVDYMLPLHFATAAKASGASAFALVQPLTSRQHLLTRLCPGRPHPQQRLTISRGRGNELIQLAESAWQK